MGLENEKETNKVYNFQRKHLPDKFPVNTFFSISSVQMGISWALCPQNYMPTQREILSDSSKCFYFSYMGINFLHVSSPEYTENSS